MPDFICKKCTGTQGCNKYCPIQAGRNLVDFINGVEVTQTSIGELREDYKTKKLGLIVSGHIIETGATSPVNILSGLSTSIDASGKFINYMGYTPQQILSLYMDSIGTNEAVKKKTIETFKRFNSNKLLPVPIKLGSECEVSYESNNGKKIVANTKVASIRWNSDQETHKLQCTLVCETEHGTLDGIAKIVKVPISEYGESIKLPQIERIMKTSEIDRELIKMSSVGFIKPIEISDGKVKIASDNQYIYHIVGEQTFIVGKWSDGDIQDIQKRLAGIGASKAYKKLMNAKNYINKHRKFMVPYGLFEANHVELD